MINRRSLIASGVGAAALMPWRARAQADKTIRIGVITDMSGVYKDLSGPTSVACTRQAVEEFTGANPDIKVEVLVADHQNKADVGLAIIRQWFDQAGVDIITNVGNTSIALGARSVIEEKDKVSLVTVAGSSDLTGKSCSANMVHWSWDSWCLAHSTSTSLVRNGGDKWFFITADYAFGHAAQADGTRFVDGLPHGSENVHAPTLTRARAPRQGSRVPVDGRGEERRPVTSVGTAVDTAA